MNYKFKLLIIGIFMLLSFILLLFFFNKKEDVLFNDNLIILETKAKEYIKYNMLPITNEKTITLEELYNNNIVPKLYYNFSECNNKSYIIIKQNGLFYEMNTTLICGNKTKVVKSYFN